MTDWTPNRVRALRARLGYTQHQLADRIGCHRQAIANWETGQRTPTGLYAQSLQSLEDAMTVTFIDELASRPDSYVAWIEIDPSANPLAAMDLFVAFDPSDRTCSLVQRHQSERNSSPAAVWHKRVLWWAMDTNVNAYYAYPLIIGLADDLAAIADGYERVWDGNNHVGSYTAAADAAISRVSSVIDNLPLLDDGGLIDADDWLQDTSAAELGVTAETTDDQLDAIADDLEASARADNWVVASMYRALDYMRDRARQDAV